MKVAFISHFAELYGANRSLLALITYLNEQEGIQPILLCNEEGALTEQARSVGIHCVIFPFTTWMSERTYMGRPHHRIAQHMRYRKQAKDRASNNARLLDRMEQAVQKLNCRLIYSNSSVIGVGHQLAQKMGLPHIWHIREFGKADYKLYLDQGKYAFANALRKAVRIIAISRAIGQYAKEVSGRSDAIVVYNGVLPRAQFAEKRAQCPWPSSGVFTFAMVGLIHPGKGHFDAVEALAQLDGTPVRLLIAGSGRSEKLKQRIEDLGIQDKIEFLGYLNDPYEAYAQSNALLMCSKKEGMGRVTAEAMAAGRPVIGYNDGATPELIIHGKTGFIYNNVVELAQQMQALANDPAMAEHMGKEGAKVAEEQFNIEQYGEKILAVLNEVQREMK